jgi:hypothetical protein
MIKKLLCLFGVSQTLMAFVAPPPKKFKHLPHPKAITLRPETTPPLKTFSLTQDREVRLDRRTSAVRLISGKLSQGQKGDTKESLLDIAKNYVEEETALLGVAWEDLFLVEKALFIGQEEQFLKFGILKNGLRLEDASLDFRFKFGELVQIATQTFSEALPEERPVLDGDSLTQKAMEHTGAKPGELTPKENTYRINPEGQTYRMVLVSNYLWTRSSGEAYLLALESATGKIFEFKDRNYYAQSQMDVYPRWFNETLQSRGIPLAQIEGAQGGRSDSQGMFETKDSLTPKIGPGLKGSYVDVKTVTGTPVQGTAVWSGQDWSLALPRKDQGSPWLDKETAQKLIYYHTTKVVEEARRYISTPWLGEVLGANANLSSTCNAHWDGRTINLYSGDSRCANTGLISDVIFHEWGHGLDDRTGGIEDGAFSEGYGDIISALMTRSALLGIGFHLPNHDPVRDLEPNKRYPDDRGEVHDEGLIIATTFWDLMKEFYAKYPAAEADQRLKTLAFRMIFTARSYLDVYDALLVIDDNDGDLLNGTPNSCLINRVFSDHGLREKDLNCNAIRLEGWQTEDGDGDGVFEPGETVRLKARLENLSQKPLTGLKGQFRLTQDSAEDGILQVSDLTWDDLLPGQKASSKNWLSFEIHPQTACGKTLSGELSLESTDQKLTLKTQWPLGKSAGTTLSFTAPNLPLPIEDKKTTLSKISLSSPEGSSQAPVLAMTVGFTLRHTYIGDITVHLLSPTGEAFLLYKGEGRGKNVTFSKDISAMVQGRPFNGDWTLKVYDHADLDQGTLDTFQIQAKPGIFVCD